MAHWYTVYHDEDYEAEIQVGLHDLWLGQLEFGPTQADRVLVHTDMMEHAHERRFAACEAHIDMSPFEADHSHRVEQAINHIQARFSANALRETHISENYGHDVLIGLSQPPLEDKQHDCSQFATHETWRETRPMRLALQNMTWQTLSTHHIHGATSRQDQLMIDASDNEENDDLEQKLCLDARTRARTKLQFIHSEGARQQKLIRYRRRLGRSSTKGTRKGNISGHYSMK